jgi:hypothetical protein
MELPLEGMTGRRNRVYFRHRQMEDWVRRFAAGFVIGLLVLVPAIGPAHALDLQLFQTQAAAQQHCPADTVVWANLPTRIYHFEGMRWYGNTKNGAYVCESEADKAGYRATRNGQ